VGLTWKDDVYTPFVEAAATLLPPRARSGSQRPSGTRRWPGWAARSYDTHEVICQDGAAQR